MQIWRRNPHLAPPSSLLLSKTTPHTLPLTTILPRMFHFLSFLSLSSPFFSYIPFLYPILFYTHSLFIKHTLYLCIFRSLCLPLRPPSTHILSSIVPFSFVTHSYHFLPLLSFFPISPIFSLSVLSPSMLTISLYVWPSSFHILIFPPSYTHSSYVWIPPHTHCVCPFYHFVFRLDNSTLHCLSYTLDSSTVFIRDPMSLLIPYPLLTPLFAFQKPIPSYQSTDWCHNRSGQHSMVLSRNSEGPKADHLTL